MGEPSILLTVIFYKWFFFFNVTVFIFQMGTGAQRCVMTFPRSHPGLGTSPTRKAGPLCITHPGGVPSPVVFSWNKFYSSREGRGNSNSAHDPATLALSTCIPWKCGDTRELATLSSSVLASLSKRQHLPTWGGWPVFKDTHFFQIVWPLNANQLLCSHLGSAAGTVV